MVKLIKEVPQCKHHKKKKLKPNEFWSPNPFEIYKIKKDSDKKKQRFDQLKINLVSKKIELHDLVKKDMRICGKEILSCCQGEFPKSK